MPPSIGVFVLTELQGALGDRIRAIHEQFDPKLARLTPPHLTIAGSSGVGMIAPDTPVAALRTALEPIAQATPPLTLTLGRPHRFPGTEIISLPLDPHGPLRALHEQIAGSGLRFLPSRFLFSPHITLSYYPTLTRARETALLGIRVEEPLVIERLQLYLTRDPQPPRRLFELTLGAPAAIAPTDRVPR
jgi:2'-5' RNA ligase